MLQHHPITLISAHTAQEALEHCQQYHPDLILTDFRLSYGNGLQLAQQGQYQQLCHLAHRLKGQCMIFHHHHLWQLFESLEELANSGNTTLIDGILTQLQHTYEQERFQHP